MHRADTDSTYGESLPPTLNELGARSRARLLRQSQKLSRVFGEVPTLDHSTSGTLQRTTSTALTGRGDQVYHVSPRKHASDDNLSIISLVPPLRTDDAKLAKLNRLLGETVPSELVFPTSPTGIRPPKRTRRRKSLDVTTFVTPSSSVEDLKRTLSDSTRRPQRKQQNIDSGVIVTEKQRAQNVKRVRKIIQVFGQQPPKELIDAPSQRNSLVEGQPMSPGSELSPMSLSVLLSPVTSTKSVSDPEDHRSEERRRKRAMRDETRRLTVFQERRRRVTKLTQFFGVGYEDIDLHPDCFPDATSTAVQVEVQLGGRRLWRFIDGEGEMPDPDMNLVLDKLRALRAE